MSISAKESVAIGSVASSAFLTVIKLIAGIFSGSISIVSEAAHSALDLVSAILTYFAVRIGDKPPDDDHHYGHGKVESVSALVEAGLLFGTALLIVYEAVHRLIAGDLRVEATWYAFAVIIISIVVDWTRSRSLLKIAKETNSQALEADALHFTTDLGSSAAVLVGLILVKCDVVGADAVAAIIVALFVFIVGYRLSKRTIDVLIDTAPKGIREVIREILADDKHIVAIEQINARPLGSSVCIDMRIHVDRKQSQAKVDEIVNTIRERVQSRIHFSDVVIHAIPVQTAHESTIEKVQLIAAKHVLPIHHVVVEDVGGKTCISYDLELPENLTVEESHDRAMTLEGVMKQEFAGAIVNTHIDPLALDEVQSQQLTDERADAMRTAILALGGRVNHIHSIHALSIRGFRGEIMITLHCCAEDGLMLSEAHHAAEELERMIRAQFSGIGKISIHVEPVSARECSSGLITLES
ncbi:MAG: cation diffusion facilitator family transporter [bacterium]|nr:cation diffusion facilitator family transporter [bacterium]